MQESKEAQLAGETRTVPSAHWVMFAQNLNFQVFKRVKNMLRRHSPIFELLAFMPFSGFWAPRSKRSLPDMLSKNLNERARAKNNSLRHKNAVGLSCRLMLLNS